jgi:hypothetical protein
VVVPDVIRDHRGGFIEAGDQVEEQLPARLGEEQVAAFVEHKAVEAGEVAGDASLASLSGLCLQPIDQIDSVEEAAARPAADAGSGDRDGEMGLAGSGGPDKDGVAVSGPDDTKSSNAQPNRSVTP